jgi:hypothetical protein
MAYNAIDIAKKINYDEPFRTDEFGRIVLSDKMIESVHKAEQSLAAGTFLTEEKFQARFAKWL